MVQSYAIMQPYFLPYIGYFALINETDQWIVFDKVQFVKQSWGNRNRILKHPDGTSWIKVPLVKHSRDILYSEVKIKNEPDWKEKMIRQFEYYKINAPHYESVIELVKDIINPEFEFLVDLNVWSMVKICEYLGITFNYTKYSDLNLNIQGIRTAGDWPLLICKKLGIQNYVNPCLGQYLFDKEAWKDEKIRLRFLVNKNLEYDQRRNHFEQRLSIIDVLMWNSKEEVLELMDSKLFCADDFVKARGDEACNFDFMVNEIND